MATLGLFAGTVLPVYVVWMTPEVFNFAVIASALVALRRQRPMLSAVLLAIAIYSKPYNVLLAIPLGLLPLLESERGGFWRRLTESARRGAVVVGGTLLLFGLNVLMTGEANYQGGERKTFHGAQFPFEERVTFGNSGEWMTTNQLGPKPSDRPDSFVGRILSLVGADAADDKSASTSTSASAEPRWTRSELARVPSPWHAPQRTSSLPST